MGFNTHKVGFSTHTHKEMGFNPQKMGFLLPKMGFSTYKVSFNPPKNVFQHPRKPWVAYPAAKPKPELQVSAGIPWTGKSFQKLWQQKLELGEKSPFFVQMWQFFLRGTGWWQCHIQGGLLSLLLGWKVSKKMSFIRGFLQGHPRGGMWNPKFHVELAKLQKQKVCIWNQPDFGNSVGEKKEP